MLFVASVFGQSQVVVYENNKLMVVSAMNNLGMWLVRFLQWSHEGAGPVADCVFVDERAGHPSLLCCAGMLLFLFSLGACLISVQG